MKFGKTVGKIMVVNKGISINKFVGLKSKMYLMHSYDSTESNTAKGENIVTEFNEFRDTLVNKKVVKMKIIQSKKHKLEKYEIKKTPLFVYDDKTFVLSDGTHTLA